MELMDTMLIALGKQRSFRDMMAAIEGQPAALLMVEFSSDDAAEVTDRIDRLRNRLKEVPGVTVAGSGHRCFHPGTLVESSPGRDAASVWDAWRRKTGHILRGLCG